MISISSNALNQIPSYLGSWGLQNPTTAKVGALVLGAGLIASIPYISPFVAAGAAVYVLGAGAALVGAAVIGFSVPLWNHNNPYVRTLAKITTLMAGVAIAASTPFTGVTHLFGVSLVAVGSSIAGVSTASMAFPVVGRVVTKGLTAAQYALTAASIAALVLPFIV